MHSRSPYLLILSCVAATLGAVLPLQAVVVDFSSSTSITDNLKAGQVVAAGSLTSSSGTGLSGGAGGALPSGTNNNFIYTTVASFSATESIVKVGTYLQIKAATGTTGSALLLGVSGVSAPESKLTWVAAGNVGVPNATAVNSDPQPSLVTALRFDSSNGKYNFTAFNNGSNAGLAVSSAFDLTAGNWYYWETTILYNNNNTYTFSAVIYNASASGALGSIAGSFSAQTVANASLVSSGSLYGLISSQAGDEKGIAGIDNFTVPTTSNIPEPSTAAIVAGLGAIGMIGFLRRRR